MKESKAVYVNRHKIRNDQNIVFHLYSTERGDGTRRYENRSNFGSQFDSKRDSVICTCKNTPIRKRRHEFRYFSGLPKQIFACQESRGLVDIGVGSVKTIQRKRVRRVYLPETDDTGVGSSDLSSFILRRRYPKILTVSSYYDNKRTSSKCVGGILEYNTGCVITQKLSPIIQTKSGSTSPKRSLVTKRNTDIGSNTIDNKLETTETQFEVLETDKLEVARPEKQEHKSSVVIFQIQPKHVVETKAPKVSEHTQKNKYSNEIGVDKKAQAESKVKEPPKTYSSDSLVQHVHNLENPSDEKHSRISFPDLMENKLEREYRKRFSTTKSKESKESKSSCDKPAPEFKSASVLRRRFEALRRGINKKESSLNKKEPVVIKTSNSEVPAYKDASVTSDPPSLISRSFSDTEKYKASVEGTKSEKNKTATVKKEKRSSEWQSSQPNSTDSADPSVKGMFKLWGKKFNFEEDRYGKRQATPMPSYDTSKKLKKEEHPKVEMTESKKEGKKFFFFKKKSKDKNKSECIQKKDVTAGRCEIKDGIVLKLGEAASSKTKAKGALKVLEESNEIIRKAWMKRFISEAMESARSVNVRWNNSLYATSSSTVFELLDSVYKNTNVVFSQSDITTGESSYYKSFTKQVNFVQDIEAWMVSKTIPDRPILKIPIRQVPIRQIKKRQIPHINSEKYVNQKNIEYTISDQKWYIEKSEAFSHKIEVVLHSNNTTQINNKKASSEYLRIDIPGNFFDSSSDEREQNNSSDEKVYKIVEYETNSEIGRARKALTALNKDDSNDIKAIVSVKDSKSLESKILETIIKRPMLNDVTIQGNDESDAQRCDVIGVGIITQRDLRDLRKPILKIRDDITDDDSEPVLQLNQKKCEFAESYLQEYYRHAIPFGVDLSQWAVSDSHVYSNSEKSLGSNHNLTDGSKSCPNIFEGLEPTIVTSCEIATTPRRHDTYELECSKMMKKFKKPAKAKTETEIATKQRYLPKDSLEVFKRRKVNATTCRAQWAKFCSNVKDVVCSVPSVQSRSCPGKMEGPKKESHDNKPRPKLSNKRDSNPDCEVNYTNQINTKANEDTLNFQKPAYDACMSKSKCAKHAFVIPKVSGEVSKQLCKNMCEMMQHGHINKPCTPSSYNAVTKEVNISGKVQVCSKPKLPPDTGLASPQFVPCQPSSKMLSNPSDYPACKSPLSCRTTMPCKTSSPRTTPPCREASLPTRAPPPTRATPSAKTSPSSKTPPACISPPGHPGNQPKTSSQPCKLFCKPWNNSNGPNPKKLSSSYCKCIVPSCSKCSQISSNLPWNKSQQPNKSPTSSPPCKKSSPVASLLKWTEKCCKPKGNKPDSKKKGHTCCDKPVCASCKNCCKSSSSSSGPTLKPSSLTNKPQTPCGLPETRSPSESPKSPSLCCSPKSQSPRGLPKSQSPCGSPNAPSPRGLPKSRSPRGSPKVQSRCGSPKSSSPRDSPNAQSPCGSPNSRSPRGLQKSRSPCGSPKLQSPRGLPRSRSPRGSLKQLKSPCKLPKQTKSPCGSTKQKQSSCDSPKEQQSPRDSPKAQPPCGSPKLQSPRGSPNQFQSQLEAPKKSQPPYVPPKQSPCGSRTGILLKQVPAPPSVPKPKINLCNLPPCNTLKKETKCKEEFPWPTKNQVSNPPSPICDSPISKKAPKCDKNCTMKKTEPECPSSKMLSPSPSNLSTFPEPDCFPDLSCEACRELNESHSPTPPCLPKLPSPPKQVCPPQLACPPEPCPPKPLCPLQNTKSKIAGIFLKMKPAKKGSCADDCTAWNEMGLAKEVSKCSIDNVTIRIKDRTPSTEEIREPVNIKVLDEDGRTLYERKDYTCENQHEAILGDLYKESKINRVDTPLTVTNLVENDGRKELTPYISDKSLLNALEINVKLCITQGDKTTEIDIGNENDEKQEVVKSDLKQSNPEVFLVNNGRTDAVGEIPKKDINIKITLRSFKSKPKHKNAKDKKRTDDFSKKISEKFQTVSTGYSDVEEGNAFSVHRATVNLASSADVSHISSKIHDMPNCAVSLQSTDLVTEDENTAETSSKIHVENNKVIKTHTNESVLPTFNETDTEEDTLIGISDTSDCNDNIVTSKSAFREQKKALLKKVFQKAGKRSKNKENVRELRDMLKVILTDSSDNDETNASSNTLAQDVTYTSLKPNYFKDTDSMNNYYKLDSNVSSDNDSKINAVYPTAEANSRTNSDTEDNDMTFRGCMCSKVAERLNQANADRIGCCCRQNYKKDEETNCDIRNAADYFLLNYKTTEYIDVETQNSRRLTSKVNSYNISIHSNRKSLTKTSEDLKVVEEITAVKSLNQRISKPITPGESFAANSAAKTEHLKEPELQEIKVLKSPVSIKVSTHVSHQKSVNKEPEIEHIYQSGTAEDNGVLVNSKLTELSLGKCKKYSKRSVKSKRSDKIEKSKAEKPVEEETDILQSYAAKKAVLEIYAEKTENGDSFVAKLPKFVVEKESEIVNNFEQIAANSYKSVCKENVSIMFVKRY